MDTTKRQRPYLERACKMMDQADPLKLSPALWRKLPVDLAYKILSFLPVDRLVDTLRKVLSRRNLKQFVRCQTFSQIFGHGKNLDSSYGFVTLLKRRRVLKLSAFEHESMQWREFPKKGHPEQKNSLLIPGGSDGLLLCASRKSSRIKEINYREYHPYLGVWNPLLGSFKWLPKHPRLTNIKGSYNKNFSTTLYKMMVDESSRTYKVFLIYTNAYIHYSVYDSVTGKWSTENYLPDFGIDFRIMGHTAACDRYVFYDGCESRRDNIVPGRCADSEDYICWLDSLTDSWDRAFLSEIVSDLDTNPESGLASGGIDSLVILHGILYMVIWTCSNDEEEKYTLASLDLTSLRHGFVPVFRFEAFIPVAQLPMNSGSYSFPFNLYTCTMQGKGYVCVRTSSSGELLQFDVSNGSWLEHDKLPELGVRRWTDGEDCFPFKASLVVP